MFFDRQKLSGCKFSKTQLPRQMLWAQLVSAVSFTCSIYKPGARKQQQWRRQQQVVRACLSPARHATACGGKCPQAHITF